MLNDKGYQVFVITNQAGIGKGIYTDKQFHILNDWMLNEFIEKGSFIDQVYYCPFHPQAKIKRFQNDTKNNDKLKEYANKQNSNIKNTMLKSYDLFLNEKYNVVLNQKTIERVKNFFQ